MGLELSLLFDVIPNKAPESHSTSEPSSVTVQTLSAKGLTHPQGRAGDFAWFSFLQSFRQTYLPKLIVSAIVLLHVMFLQPLNGFTVVHSSERPLRRLKSL